MKKAKFSPSVSSETNISASSLLSSNALRPGSQVYSVRIRDQGPDYNLYIIDIKWGYLRTTVIHMCTYVYVGVLLVVQMESGGASLVSACLHRMVEIGQDWI